MLKLGPESLTVQHGGRLLGHCPSSPPPLGDVHVSASAYSHLELLFVFLKI